MTREEAFKLTPEISYVIFAKGKYRVAYVAEEFGVTWIGIYDEPPSLHTDRIQAGHCELSLPPAEGAIKHLTDEEIEKNGKDGGLRDNELQMFWEGATFYRNYIQRFIEEHTSPQNKPQPTAEGAEEMIVDDFTKIGGPITWDYLVKGNAGYTIERTAELMRKFAAQRQPQPTAEGTDVIASLIESLGEPTEVHNHSYSIRPYTVEGKTEWWMFHDGVGSGEPLAQWLNKFATLYARKMLRENLREELIKFYKYVNDEWALGMLCSDVDDVIASYLKSKEQ